MEARATVSGQSVSKTFVAAILVLVAMGLGAMGGYVAKGLSGAGVTGSQTQVLHPAPGTVLRQDNPAQSTSQRASDAIPSTAPIRPIRGGIRGEHLS